MRKQRKSKKQKPSVIKKYVEKNPEKTKERRKNYYWKDPEKYKDQARKYNAEHKEEISKKKKENYMRKKQMRINDMD